MDGVPWVWQGEPGVALPAPHPTSRCVPPWGTGPLNSRRTCACSAHACACTCMWGDHAWVCKVHTPAGRHWRGPLQPPPARWAAKPCRIQLSPRNKSFYSRRRGPLLRPHGSGWWEADRRDVGERRDGVDFVATPPHLPCPG